MLKWKIGKKMSVFERLTLKIFTFFLLTVTFLLIFVSILPRFDIRNLSPLTTEDRLMGNSIANKISRNLANSSKNVFPGWLKFSVVMNKLEHSGQYFFIITPTEQIITSHTKEIKLIQDFIKQPQTILAPAKKIYKNKEILGPYLIDYNNGNYRLYILQRASKTQPQFMNLIFDYPFLLLALTMLISSPLLLWLASSLAKPAHRLKKAADQVAKGNLQEWPELEKLGSSEYKATGRSFNRMLRELNRMQELQKRLFSDISHELRTPLTRLQLAIALLRRKQGESNEVTRIYNEALKLDSMIGDLLLLAKQQYTNNEVSQLKAVNELFNPVLNNAIFESEQIGKQFIIKNDPPNETILCYPLSLCSALENIIRNAFRYSYKIIEINFSIHNENIILTIEDDGPGVAEHELEKIFIPFYRTSEARDRESGGTGIGLAIVANAITRNNGLVKAQKSDLGGLKIMIKLPISHKI